ncbi:MAG: VOC family protein [Actinomycetota bacterium]
MELTRLLVVSDVDRSREWYASVLGASVVREYERPPASSNSSGRGCCSSRGAVRPRTSRP